MSCSAFIPVALGAGKSRTDLPNKLAALSHQIWVEVASLRDFQRMVDSVVAFCGDLGTEAGFANAPAMALSDVLPGQSSNSMSIEVGEMKNTTKINKLL